MSAVAMTSMGQTRHSTRPADRYFVSAPVDGLLIGGASVLLYALSACVRSWPRHRRSLR